MLFLRKICGLGVETGLLNRCLGAKAGSQKKVEKRKVLSFSGQPDGSPEILLQPWGQIGVRAGLRQERARPG